MSNIKKDKEVLHYTAIGDSLTVGVGSAVFTFGFVGWYNQLSQWALQRPVFPQVFAKIGATTVEILQSLSIPEVATHVAQTDIITLTAGGNDLIHAAETYLMTKKNQILDNALNRSTTHIAKIIEKIHALKSQETSPYLIRIVNLYNPFPNLPEADPWIREFNSHLLTFSKMPYIGIADVYHAFAGRQNKVLSSDHIHPNPLGYKIMADVTSQLGYA